MSAVVLAAAVALTVVGDAIPESLTRAAGDAARGKAIVLDRQVGMCLLCHSGPFADQRFQGDLAPDLSGVGSRLSEGQIRLRLVDPGGVNATTIMPAYLKTEGLERVASAYRGQTVLTAQQIEDVVAFLATLKGAAAASPAALGMPRDERRSGYQDMSRETRDMQDDDGTNPGMFWVLEGENLFKPCAACHTADSMKGVAARYPARDKKSGKLLNLEQRINACRTDRLKDSALAYESRELLSLTALVAKQSRGMPIDVQKSEPGEKFYRLRQGQLNLSCAQCHDERWGKKLAGNPIPQGHATGYPLYRLEWQNLGSLQRRLRNCLTGMRAELFPLGAPELVELEAYLMWRARGMKVESPAVRP